VDVETGTYTMQIVEIVPLNWLNNNDSFLQCYIFLLLFIIYFILFYFDLF
jgi:hypothetical protein